MRRAPRVAARAGGPLLAILTLACAPRGAEPAAGAARAGGGDSADASELATRSLPYLTWVPAGRLASRGVVELDRARAAAGLDLYAPRNRAAAFLIDNAGGVLHEWHQDGVADGWHHVEPVADGGLLAIVKDRELVRLDWDSRILWRVAIRAHHDVAPAPDGGVWVADRAVRRVPAAGGELPVLDDRLVELGPDRRVRRRLSMFDLFAGELPAPRWDEVRAWLAAARRGSAGGREPQPEEGTPADLFHLNSVELVGRDVAGWARAGDLLISLRGIDTVALLDPRSGRVRWRWGPGVLEGQHHASLLDDGHVLIFDNGIVRQASRALEMDPATGKVVWQYPAPGAPGFYSYTRGAAQRLRNGDTLITDSDNGRAVEVTAAGRTVWEFLCPEMQTEGEPPQPVRAAIYRLRRLEPEDLRRFGVARRLSEARGAAP